MDIHHLLNYLGALFPLSPTFIITLENVMYEQEFSHKQKLLEPPQRAVHAWFLLEGVVSASVFDKDGQEVVIRLYLPKVVFTDFNSFLYGRASSVMLRAVGNVLVQHISIGDFKLRMTPFSQTNDLKEHIILRDQLLDQQRSMLIHLPDEDRFNEFSAFFPMNDLPNVVGASFLNMGTTKYCNLKAAWNSRNK
jgi:hypothetical protein